MNKIHPGRSPKFTDKLYCLLFSLQEMEKDIKSFKTELKAVEKVNTALFFLTCFPCSSDLPTQSIKETNCGMFLHVLYFVLFSGVRVSVQKERQNNR